MTARAPAWPFFRPHFRRHRRTLAVGAAAALGTVAARLALPWPLRAVVRPWLAQAGAGEPASAAPLVTGNDVLRAGLAFFGLYVALGVCDAASRVLFSRFVVAAVGDARREALERWRVAGSKAPRGGDLLTRVVGDSARLKEGLKGFLVHVVTNGALFVGATAVLLAVSPALGAVFGGALALTVAVTVGMARRVLRKAKKLRKREGERAGAVLRATRAAGSEGNPLASRARRAPRASLTRLQGLAGWQVYTLLGAAIVVGLHVAVRGTGASPDDLFLFASYALILLHPVVRLARQGTRTGKLLACARRMAATAAPAPRLEGQGLAPLREGVTLDEVALDGADGRRRVGPVSLAIRAGERIAVIGSRGSGKSSLLELLARRRPIAGRVLWDGVDLAPVPSRERTARVAWARPGAGFRGGPLAALLPADRPLPGVLARRVAELPGDRDAWIAAGDLALPEARALATAGACAADADLVLLDDALLGLGPEEAAARADELLAEVGDAALVAVLARAEEAAPFGRLVVLDAGRVVHDGAPDEYLRPETAR